MAARGLIGSRSRTGALSIRRLVSRAAPVTASEADVGVALDVPERHDADGGAALDILIAGIDQAAAP